MAYRKFKGWSVSFKKVMSNLNVYPIYKDKKNIYYLTFDLTSIKGGSYNMQAVSMKAGTKYNLSRRYSMKERFLVGYTTQPKGKGTFYASPSVITMPKCDMVLYPKFAKKASVVALTLKAGRGNYSYTALYKKGEKVTVGESSLQTSAGYTLVGYSTKANGKGKFYALGSTYTMPKKNATLHGVWKKNTVRVRIVANRAKGVSVDYYVPAGYALPIHPSAYQISGDGNGFDNVYLKSLTTKKNGKGKKYAMTFGKVTASTAAPSYITVPKKGLTLYAQWAKYKKLKVNGNYSGASTDTMTYQPGYNASVNSYYYRDGYQLVGYTTKKNGGGTFYTPGCTFRITKNVTLYAQWKKYNAAIQYNYNYSGGGTYTTQTVATRPTETDGWAYRDGYRVVSWNTKKNGKGTAYSNSDLYASNNVNASLFKAKNMTLYAQWQKAPKLTFVANNGTSSKYTITISGSYRLSSTMGYTKSGKALAGWNTKANGKGVKFVVGAYLASMPSSGLKLYAQWKKPTAKITFSGNGKAANQVLNAMCNAYNYVPYVSDPTPTDDTFYFKGWNTKANGKGDSVYMSYNTVYVPKAGKTVYAIWGKKAKVSFDGNKGIGYEEDKYVMPGSGVELYDASRAFMLDGYDLIGWSTDPDAEYADYGNDDWYYTDGNDGSTVTLYAVWQKKE